MQKFLYTALIAAFLMFLAGCQSGLRSNNLFANPFNSSSYPAPMTLTQSVQDALAGSDDPVLAQVHVEANQNTVILSGYVKKIRQSDMAEQLARQVPGVQNVENHLIVRQ